jgi:Domain of unknown function (DUF4372)/Transposase DDE domain
VNRFCSMFSQILKLIPRLEFESLVRRTRAERHARGLRCWDQFVAMLFCQMGRAHSLREICNGLSTCEGKLTHLGIAAPKRSSLAYANAHRPWELYRDVFVSLLERVRSELPAGKKFRFKNKLVSLDSSVIDLCCQMYDWAKFRRTKGAIKLHLLLDHDGYLPCFAVVTEGVVHDVKVAQGLRFARGTVVVFDRGYNDYQLFGLWTEEEVYFVTRMKDNAVYEVIEECELPHNRNLLKDQLIRLSGARAQDKCPHILRRVEVWDNKKEQVLVFLTNNLNFAASTIAAIYKDRWQVELLFKALKQNLKIKTFVGTSPNAVKIQVWSALIAMLILRYLQIKSRFGWSLSNLVALLRMNLFTYRDLWAWLDQPFGTPPPDELTLRQEVLALA